MRGSPGSAPSATRSSTLATRSDRPPDRTGRDQQRGGRGVPTGYSILRADDLAAALELARGCPQLAAGGTVEVYETFEVM